MPIEMEWKEIPDLEHVNAGTLVCCFEGLFRFVFLSLRFALFCWEQERLDGDPLPLLLHHACHEELLQLMKLLLERSEIKVRFDEFLHELR